MSDFSWGDPHPRNADRVARKFEADVRTLRRSIEKLKFVDSQLMLGPEGVRAGLRLFDADSENFCHWQRWAAARVLRTPLDRQVAALCGQFAFAGHSAAALRLHAEIRINWCQAAVDSYRLTNNRQAEGEALGNLANAWHRLGELGKARDFHEKSLALAVEYGDKHGEYSSLFNIANIILITGEASVARVHYERALAVLDELQNDGSRKFLEAGDEQRRAECEAGLGMVHERVGEYAAAADRYQRVLGAAYRRGDTQFQIHVLSLFARVQSALGAADTAVDIYERGLALATGLGDKQSECSLLAGLGNALVQVGQTRRGLDAFARALQLAKCLCDRRMVGSLLGSLGSTWKRLGGSREAIECLEQSLAIVQSVGDLQAVSTVSNNLGKAYTDVGDWGRAHELYDRALSSAKQCGDSRAIATATSNMGHLLLARGDVDGAMKMQTEALAAAAAAGDPSLEVSVLNELGLVWAKQENYSRAAECHERALLLAQKHRLREAEGKSSTNLGLAWAGLEDGAKAVELFGRAIRIAEETGDQYLLASNLYNTALALCKTGQLETAIGHAEHARAIYERLESPYAEVVRHGLVQMFERGIEWAQAEGVAKVEGFFCIKLGELWAAQGDQTQAIEWYSRARGYAHLFTNREMVGDLYHNLSVAHRENGSFSDGLECAQEAFGIYTQVGSARAENLRDFLEYAYDRIVTHATESKGRVSVAALHNTIGSQWQSMGDPNAAIRHFDVAREASRLSGETEVSGMAALYSGEAWLAAGRPDSAAPCFSEAAGIFGVVADKFNRIAALLGLGNAILGQGDATSAFEVYTLALGEADASDLTDFKARCLWNLALVQKQTGDLTSAMDFAERALTSFRSVDSPLVPSLQEEIGRWAMSAS